MNFPPILGDLCWRINLEVFFNLVLQSYLSLCLRLCAWCVRVDGYGIRVVLQDALEKVFHTIEVKGKKSGQIEGVTGMGDCNTNVNIDSDESRDSFKEVSEWKVNWGLMINCCWISALVRIFVRHT